ncbi:hypothetical protein MKN04_17625 [Paenibacillus polymyxa]|uniref:hypothetical protein n=1 Tax=Paenibacillus polymyxa TaxID=1406 RepID=UPI0004D99B16|nr:hypothetical protein [Paenibacillus polymyxa]KEO77424.1 hypothetical protein EL23_18365 [Paenibacillus polymyxa]MCH6189463.1 hypothetical protein [Paenibacillus polymyxa]WRL59887.1 hypothetical protein U3G77_17300 [Paenibacillus polymyxa]
MMKLASKWTVLALMMMLITTAGATAQGYTPVATAENQETIYINQMEIRDGQIYLSADPIEWYEGAAADKAFVEHEGNTGLDGAPDGYYIVNNSVQNDVYQVAPDASVEVQIYDHTGNIEDTDVQWNESIPLTQFEKDFAKKDVLDLSQFPYHVTLRDGKVVKIVQQFIP